MADDVLLAQYAKQQVVRDRNFSGLLTWAASISAQDIPEEKPPEEWVRERLVAERIPTQTMSFVDRTMSYFMQDPTAQTNLRQFLSQWNDETTEVALSAQNASIITAFMPRFAPTDVSDDQIARWYLENGFAEVGESLPA